MVKTEELTIGGQYYVPGYCGAEKVTCVKRNNRRNAVWEIRQRSNLLKCWTRFIGW